jgi:hypothetical protein
MNKTTLFKKVGYVNVALSMAFSVLLTSPGFAQAVDNSFGSSNSYRSGSSTGSSMSVSPPASESSSSTTTTTDSTSTYSSTGSGTTGSSYDSSTTSGSTSPYFSSTPVRSTTSDSSSTSTYSSSTPTEQTVTTRQRFNGMNPAAKIVVGTTGGAVLGGGVGALTGLTIKAVSPSSIGFSHGTSALRGLTWGAAYGACAGFLVGLGSAIFGRDPVAVSSTTTSYR